MKQILVIANLVFILHHYSFTQTVGIGTITPDSSAQLDISNTAKGLLIPRMSTAAINSIVHPAKSLMVYDTTKNELMVNMGTRTAPNWKTIANNSSWSTGGNTGTDPATQFIGTLDNSALHFRVNNKMAGRIDSVSNNTGLGFRAGQATTGTSNTAVGFKSLFSNTSGFSNTAVGKNALYSNLLGDYNSAVGHGALFSNILSNSNTAIGYNALYTSAGGTYNTAIGREALYSNISGSYNTASGYLALFTNATGIQNVAMGYQAAKNNTTGSYNIAIGAGTFRDNTTGEFNTAIGFESLHSNISGHYNTAVGADALINTTASNNNTAIGGGAGTNLLGWNNTLIGAQCNTGSSGIFNGVGLGNATTITASNQARIGNSSTSSIGGFAGWTNISDGRYKKDVHEDVIGLAFIMKLRPVTYHLDVTNLRIKLKESSDKLKESGMQSAIAEKESMVQTGFIAQEVEQAAMALGYDFSGVDKPKNENDLYGLRYAEFVVPLVKAMQEQQLVIDDLKKQNEDLLTRLDKLESTLTSGNAR